MGFSLKKAVNKVTNTVKNVVKNPGNTLEKVVKTQVAGATGVVTGFITGGPAGAVTGGVSASVREAARQSKTGKSAAFNLRSVSQSAATGALGGLVPGVAKGAAGLYQSASAKIAALGAKGGIAGNIGSYAKGLTGALKSVVPAALAGLRGRVPTGDAAPDDSGVETPDNRFPDGYNRAAIGTDILRDFAFSQVNRGTAALKRLAGRAADATGIKIEGIAGSVPAPMEAGVAGAPSNMFLFFVVGAVLFLLLGGPKLIKIR